jgi:hypothetical protein
MDDISFANNNDGKSCSNYPVIYLLLPSSSVGTDSLLNVCGSAKKLGMPDNRASFLMYL